MLSFGLQPHMHLQVLQRPVHRTWRLPRLPDEFAAQLLRPLCCCLQQGGPPAGARTPPAANNLCQGAVTTSRGLCSAVAAPAQRNLLLPADATGGGWNDGGSDGDASAQQTVMKTSQTSTEP